MTKKNNCQNIFFLSAFAIADDLGAVLIIALFYTQKIVWHYFIVCIFFVFALALANFLWIRWTLLYVLLGLGIWFAVLGSGIHPTVAGIVVAMFIPARGKYDTDRFVQKVKKLMGGFQCEDQSCGYSILLDRGLWMLSMPWKWRATMLRRPCSEWNMLCCTHGLPS